MPFKRLAKRMLGRLPWQDNAEAFARKYLLSNTLRQIFRRRQINCVLDVGASTGKYRDFLREFVGYQGLIDWQVFNLALGSRDEERTLKIMRSKDFSSFLDPDPSSAFVYKNSVQDYCEVEVRCLDVLLPSLRLVPDPHVFLKIDTQGFDLEVLRGAAQTLPKFFALQTELSMRPIYIGGPLYNHVMDYLKKAGFEAAGMFEVSRDPDLRLVEFDCVLLNQKAQPW
jgi:FkbM family methyltransferase